MDGYMEFQIGDRVYVINKKREPRLGYTGTIVKSGRLFNDGKPCHLIQMDFNGRYEWHDARDLALIGEEE